MMEKVQHFVQDVKNEMNKVSWPSQKELMDNTTVVIVFSIILSIFIFLVDRVYSTVLEYIY